MDTLPTIAIQLGLIFIPVLLFIFIKKPITAVAARLVCAVVLALISAACAYHFASVYGWRPMAKSGKSVPLGPTALAAIHGVTLIFVLVVLTFAKKKADEKTA